MSALAPAAASSPSFIFLLHLLHPLHLPRSSSIIVIIFFVLVLVFAIVSFASFFFTYVLAPLDAVR